MGNTEIKIDNKAVFVGLSVILLFFFVDKVINFLILLFVAFLISISLGPILDYAIKKGIPRSLALILIMTTFAAILFFIIFIAITPFIDQLINLFNNLPYIISSVYLNLSESFPSLKSSNSSEIISKIISNVSITPNQDLIGSITVIFGGLLAFITNLILIIVISGFLLAERGLQTKEKVMIKKLLNKQGANHFMRIYKKIQTNLAVWVRNLLLINSMMAFINFFLFSIFGFPYALAMAILTFVLETIPNIGQFIYLIIGAVLAIGSGANPIIVLVYILITIVIQQVVGMFVWPIVNRNSIGINPIITIIAIFLAFELYGLLAAFVVIPLVAIIQIIIEDYIGNSAKSLKTKNL